MEQIKQDFLSRVKTHKMTILRDGGVWRHLRFNTPGSGVDLFEIVTWPDHLCIRGDVGAFVFKHRLDMFKFFATTEELDINPDYWAKKIVAEDKGGVKKFNYEAFKQAIQTELDRFFEEYPEHSEWENGCRQDAMWQVETCNNESDAQRMIEEFSYMTFDFSNIAELDIRDYTFHFIWCLYAIVWGIRKYYDEKQT